MKRAKEHGSTLVVGLMLLAVVTLLGLAGAAGARIEQQLAHNDQFRENAASAASAGIEHAIMRIVTSNNPDAVPSTHSAILSESDRFETVTRFAGFDAALPQVLGSNLAGAHFEITSTGHSSRNAVDRQRAQIMLIVTAPPAALAVDCAQDGLRCFEPGELVRLSWQRLTAP
jgi:Tfp pilus assembly protein PilX